MASTTKPDIKLEDLIDLDGPQGNAFAIMASVIEAMRMVGRDTTYIKGYVRKATASDYEQLKQVSLEEIQKLSQHA